MFFWQEHQKFFKILENYKKNLITYEMLDDEICILYNKLNKKFDQKKIDCEFLKTFRPQNKSKEFSSYFIHIYRSLELLEDEFINKSEFDRRVREVMTRFKLTDSIGGKLTTNF